MTLSAAAYYALAGIRINAIAPGLVRTPMSVRAQGDPRLLEYMVDKQPLTRGMRSRRHRQGRLLSSAEGLQPHHRPGGDGGWRMGSKRMSDAKGCVHRGRCDHRKSAAKQEAPAFADSRYRQLSVSASLEFASAHLDEFGPADIDKMRHDAVITAVHDQVGAGLDVITDGEQTRYDFNLSFYGRLEGIATTPISPRHFGPPAHDQRGKYPVTGTIISRHGLGAVPNSNVCRKLRQSEGQF